MKRAKAFDPETGRFVGVFRASEVTDATRHSHAWQCPEEACPCTVHWRKEVRAHANTEYRAPTFVKNRSSEHREGCYQDYERIARAHHDYTYFEDGAFHVRVNFPLGSWKTDLYPARGYLSEQLKSAAYNKKNIQPFANLKDLTAFLEKIGGDIDRDDRPPVIMHYQGRSAAFDEKLVGNLLYERLYDISIRHNNQQKVTPVALTIVKPDHEIEPNEKGKRRFVCAAQDVKINGRKHQIKPVIVCYPEEDVASSIEKAIAAGETLLIAARPFSNGMRTGVKDTPVYLSVRKPEQIASIDSKYWRVIVPPQLRLALPEPVPAIL